MKSWKEKRYTQDSDIKNEKEEPQVSIWQAVDACDLINIAKKIYIPVFPLNTFFTGKNSLEFPSGFSRSEAHYMSTISWTRDHFIPTITLLLWSEVLYPRQNLVESQSRTTTVYGGGYSWLQTALTLGLLCCGCAHGLSHFFRLVALTPQGLPNLSYIKLSSWVPFLPWYLSIFEISKILSLH